MTAAETLRTAATLMRERAEGADEFAFLSPGDMAGYACDGSFITPADEAIAEHYAPLSPAVTLAVADWLDAAVDRYDAVVDTFAPGSPVARNVAAANVDGWTEAIAVANAYLNTTQEPT